MSLEQESIMKKMTWIVAALLAGCGGGTDVVVSSPGPEPQPEQFPDAFVAEVTRVVAAAPEDTEAAAIDLMAAATAPENSEAATL
jgi:hypothetical protein